MQLCTCIADLSCFIHEHGARVAACRLDNANDYRYGILCLQRRATTPTPPASELELERDTTPPSFLVASIIFAVA